MPCNCSGFCFMNEPYQYLVNEIKNFDGGGYKDMLNRYLQHRIDLEDKKVYNIENRENSMGQYSSTFKQFKSWVKTNEKPTFNYFKMLSLHLKNDEDYILKVYYDGFMEIQHNNEANDDIYKDW